MREKLSDYQEEYGDLYNLEATPAESTTYRLAKHDKERYPEIITAGDCDGVPYYTNSSHLPVSYTEDIFSALDIQDELQTLYTSGTVFHAFLGERLKDWKSCAELVRKIAENYKLPYYTMSPTYSVCESCGYINGEVNTCPKCGKETEIYSRITGYYRPVKNWNAGKTEEFKQRKTYDLNKSKLHGKDYYEDANTIKDFSITMLVNKYNGLDKDFIPDNLISIDKEYAIDSKQKGNKEMIENFIKMSDDCKTETGFKIIVRSGYRDYKSQEDTYNLYLKTYGLKYAESYAAHPGFSEHQTGLAVDIKAQSSNTFAGTKESKWLLENAYKYGFILRYPDDLTDITGYKYESWHYRYVGIEIAKDIKDKKMSYDEYYIRYLDK